MDEELIELIDENKGYSYSNHDIEKSLGRDINIVKYSDLKNFNNIDELLGVNGECIILYQTFTNYGHWVCCFKRGNIVSFFDSYGLKPDDQFHKISIKFRKDLGIKKPYLTYLLYDNEYKIEYNQYQLQEYGDTIATCGRWVVERLKTKHLTPKQFYNLFKSEEDFTSDDLVILSTIII